MSGQQWILAACMSPLFVFVAILILHLFIEGDVPPWMGGKR